MASEGSSTHTILNNNIHSLGALFKSLYDFTGDTKCDGFYPIEVHGKVS